MTYRILFLFIISTLFLFNPSQVHAQSPIDDCNQFERIQSILLSEGTSQPFETKLELARVIVSKGACYLESDFYTGYGVALSVLREKGYEACRLNTHCRAYFYLYGVDAGVRESAALAAHVALTESPRVPRYHMDAANNEMAYWWFSDKACPNVFDGGLHWFISGEFRVC